MLDHISLAVADFARSRAFYDRVLATLGHRRVMEVADAPDFVAAGYGARAGATGAATPGRSACRLRRREPRHGR